MAGEGGTIMNVGAFIGALVMTALIFLAIYAGLRLFARVTQRQEEREWNDGICLKCGGDWKPAEAYGPIGGLSTMFMWECSNPECDNETQQVWFNRFAAEEA